MDDKELLTLRIYKADAVEALADNERVIKANSERIALLEWHLEKLRELIFHGYMQSAGIAPMVFVALAMKQALNEQGAAKTKPHPTVTAIRQDGEPS